jgi:V8-like Glu-specific endopeptidase
MDSQQAPLQHSELAKRPPVRPDRDAAQIEHEITVCEFRLDEGTEPRVERDPADPRQYRVLARVGADGLNPSTRHERVPQIRLSDEDIAEFSGVRELEGYWPSSTTINFVPRQIDRVQPPWEELGEDGDKADGRDRGGTIWGADNRGIFQDQSFPWRTTGLIRTAGRRCSGTTIGSRLVLTASHCINWGDGDGVGSVTFTPAYFDGSGPFGTFAATQVIFWNQATGLLSDQETAFDYVVLVMERRVGDIVGFPGFRIYNESWNGGDFWQYVGYPAEIDSGERPAFQGGAIVSSVSDESLSGQTGFVMGHFNEFTPGQSGGTTWGWWENEPWPRVVGVGSTIGSITVQQPPGTTANDNEYGGGPALSALIAWARSNFP